MTLIGRTRESGQIDLAIGDGRDGFRCALVTGEAGIGKSSLIMAAAERAEGRGFSVIVVRGRAGSLSTPFAPLVEAMEELATAPTTDDGFGLALTKAARTIAATRPLLIVVDDFHALDASSAAALCLLSSVESDVDVSVVFVSESGIAAHEARIDALRSAFDGQHVLIHVDVAAMPHDDLRELVTVNAPADTPRVQIDSIVERSCGNPWFALALSENRATALPVDVEALATSRLLALDEDSQYLIECVALCPAGALRDWLDQIEDVVDAAASVGLGVDAGLLTLEGDTVRMVNPLVAEGVALQLTSAARRSAHRELVMAIADAPSAQIAVSRRARAFHLANSGRSAEAASVYIELARDHERASTLHEARFDYSSALELDLDAGTRVEVLCLSASVATQLGADDAVSSWQEIARIASVTNDDELYARALYETYLASGYEMLQPLIRASHLDRSAIGWSAQAAAMVSYDELDNLTSRGHAERAVEIARATGDQLLESIALTSVAYTTAYLGDHAASIPAHRRAIELSTSIGAHHRAVLPWMSLAITLAEAGDLSAALEEATLVDTYVREHGLDRFRPTTLATLADLLCEAGDLVAAASTAAHAVRLDVETHGTALHSWSTTSHAVGAQARIANEAGASSASDVVASALEAASRSDEHWVIEAKYDEFRVIARRCGITTALSSFVDTGPDAEPALLSRAAIWLLRESVLTGCVPGVDFVRELRTNYEQWDVGGRVSAIRDEIDATFAAVDRGEYDALKHVARRWDELGAKLDCARVTAVIGTLLHRAGLKEPALDHLRAAKRLLTVCGATGDADVVAAMLRENGVRSRATAASAGVGNLSQRELDVARMIASGLTTKEIAAKLHLAAPTIASHVANIYGKVGVRTRAQLGEWTRANDPGFELVSA